MATSPTIKTASNGKSLAWSIREEDLDDLEKMRGELLGRAQDSLTDGRLFMSSFYTKLAATVAPEIKRIRDRFDRESLAATRRELKDRKVEERAKAQASQ
jgi:hypothetical protein